MTTITDSVIKPVLQELGHNRADMFVRSLAPGYFQLRRRRQWIGSSRVCDLSYDGKEKKIEVFYNNIVRTSTDTAWCCESEMMSVKEKSPEQCREDLKKLLGSAIARHSLRL